MSLSPRSCRILGLVLIVAFLGVQGSSLDYGTRINDLPHIRDYSVTADIISGSALDRPTVLGPTSGRAESLDLWMVRFKLYTVDSDEVNNLVALARIRISEGLLDPHYYQYGGAYLYALGGWYFMLVQLGIIDQPTIPKLLTNPDQVDRIWIAGRLFVLLAVAGSALFLLLALSAFAPPGVVLVMLGLYLIAPATIMFSQVLKPHWYGLLWSNIALWILARAFTCKPLTIPTEAALGIALGLAVGSAITYGLFSALVWGALIVLVFRKRAILYTLARVPMIAVAAFLASNPYYVLSREAVAVERNTAAGWFHPSVDPEALLLFLKSSFAGGYGIVFSALLLSAIVGTLLRRGAWSQKLMAIAVLVPVVATAAVTASMASWHFNFRYMPYVLPAALLFVAACAPPVRLYWLGAALIVSVVQAGPLVLAYHDENHTVHSTRLAAAAWIDTHIPSGDAVCLGTPTPAPFETPPFRFDARRINVPECLWKVVIERDADSVKPPEDGFVIARRFQPRLSWERLPFVWGHINPQISIYRRQTP